MTAWCRSIRLALMVRESLLQDSSQVACAWEYPFSEVLVVLVHSKNRCCGFGYMERTICLLVFCIDGNLLGSAAIHQQISVLA
jgi:hypothetical protein